MNQAKDLLGMISPSSFAGFDTVFSTAGVSCTGSAAAAAGRRPNPVVGSGLFSRESCPEMTKNFQVYTETE